MVQNNRTEIPKIVKEYLYQFAMHSLLYSDTDYENPWQADHVWFVTPERDVAFRFSPNDEIQDFAHHCNRQDFVSIYPLEEHIKKYTGKRAVRLAFNASREKDTTFFPIPTIKKEKSYLFPETGKYHCLACFEVFEPKTSSQRYCSVECYQSARKGQRKAKQLQKKWWDDAENRKNPKKCKCGCGRILPPPSRKPRIFFNDACRKRFERNLS